jgi:hypothetical protein
MQSMPQQCDSAKIRSEPPHHRAKGHETKSAQRGAGSIQCRGVRPAATAGKAALLFALALMLFD